MTNLLELKLVNDKENLELFWNLFGEYIDELSVTATMGDEFDRDYFYSDEYRDAIEAVRVREKNPLRMILIRNDDNVLGFLMYVTYFDKGQKCFLMEYYITPRKRNFGNGSKAYEMIEKYIKTEGAAYIELTPTNDQNERFWTNIGFNKTDDLDDDNKYYYRKVLAQ